MLLTNHGICTDDGHDDDDDDDDQISLMMSSSMFQSSYDPSGKYRRMIIGIFFAL